MKRRVDSRPVAAGLASGERYTNDTVAPRRISLASDRVKPSSARCAICSCGLPVSSGVVPMTTTRPDGPMLRNTGVKNSYRRLQSGGLGDAGGIEHQAAERVGPAAADVVGHHVVVLGQRKPHGLDDAALTADQQGTRQRRLPGAVAAQRFGLRDAELLGEEVSGRRVNEL